MERVGTSYLPWKQPVSTRYEWYEWRAIARDRGNPLTGRCGPYSIRKLMVGTSGVVSPCSLLSDKPFLLNWVK